MVILGVGAALSYFSPRPRHCSPQFTSTRRRCYIWLFSFNWDWWWNSNTNPTSTPNKRSRYRWSYSCEGEVLWHLQVVSSTPLLTLLCMWQLCGKIWSPLPLGGPVHWAGMFFKISCFLQQYSTFLIWAVVHNWACFYHKPTLNLLSYILQFMHHAYCFIWNYQKYVFRKSSECFGIATYPRNTRHLKIKIQDKKSS